MDQHGRHAERVGDEAGMLAAGAAEAVERVARDVVAALHGNLLDRVRHVFDRDPDEAVGNLLRRAAVADFFRQFGEGCADCVGIERLVLRRPKDFRKKIGDQLADHHVGVRNGKRPAAAVALRSRIGAGRIRADTKARAVEMQDRAAAGGHGMDQHHRRAHAHARDLGLERSLVLASKMRHVRRRAAHVEADEVREAGAASGLRHADDARGRS